MFDSMSFEEKAMHLYKNKNWDLLRNLLDSKFKVEKGVCCPVVRESTIKTLDELLIKFAMGLLENKTDFHVVKHLFKALRNTMSNPDVDYIFITEKSLILINSHKILQAIATSEDAECVECTKMLMQFLVNLVVGNPACAEKIWQIFSLELKQLVENKLHSYYASALVYNIFCNNPHLAPRGKDVFKAVFNMYKEDSDNNEYLTFLLEHFISSKEVNCTYTDYNDVGHRILCLQMLQQVLKDGQKVINVELIVTISNEFKTKSECILKTVDCYLQEIEAVEVSLLADVLACLSSDEKYLGCLQADKSLLVTCVFLLRSIHSLGVAFQNEFTPIEKLSELQNPSGASQSHPAFGFKAALIRLLGNLAWKDKANQDEMRLSECIPLLLDCCNIDARNPFIIQWVIFAIRNLCENNEENQKYIASMNNRGAVSSAALHEMGITLHHDGVNQIKIVPLEFKK